MAKCWRNAHDLRFPRTQFNYYYASDSAAANTEPYTRRSNKQTKVRSVAA